MTLQEIQELIKILNKSNISELRLERDDVKLTLRTKDYMDGRMMVAPSPAPMVMPVAPVPMQTAPAAAGQSPVSSPTNGKESADADNNKEFITVKSPMIGTFYRASGPDKDSFVNVGDVIKPGQVLCIIEAMKLFNEIESEVSGKIVKMLIDNATPVEYDQPLFLVDPKG